MEQQPSKQTPEKKSRLTQKVYTDPAEKKKDFWRGVGLWFGLNILLALCSWGVNAALVPVVYPPDGSSTPLANAYPVISLILGALPLLINIGLIIYFALTRSQIALGMLAGFGSALLITICLGVVFAVWCFVALGGSGPGG